MASIIADIGGTNARFAIVDGKGDVSNIKIFQVREIPTLISALVNYKNNFCSDVDVSSVAIAVAGPVLGDVVKLTNSDWVCNKKEISEALGVKKIFVLNDFEALAVATISLPAGDFSVMQAGNESRTHPKIIMGPGTGLGIAALKPVLSGGFEAITTEAGHIRYAPANDRESKLVKFLGQSLGFVCAEHLISGPGLVNLYKANCHLVGEAPKECSPSEVVEWARAGDMLCKQVIDDFSAIFGSFASQIALSYIALGGLYLTGGVLKKLEGDFNASRFLERFVTNPNMSELLRQVPVFRLTTDIPAFAGLRSVIIGCRGQNKG